MTQDDENDSSPPIELQYASCAAHGKRSSRLLWWIGGGILLGLALIFLVLPAFTLQRDVGYNQLECFSHMHQIGLACVMYANGDPLSRFPNDLQTIITTQQLSSDVFVCPSTNDTNAPGNTPAEQASHLFDGGHKSYIYVGAGLTLNSPPDAVALFEPLADHHATGANVLFADGHVEFLKPSAVEQIIKQDQSGVRPIYWPMRPATQPSLQP